MGEIKFTKDQYDQKCNYLNYMSGYINVDDSQTVEVGKNVSQTVTDFINIYEELKGLVRDYTGALSITVSTMRNAGDAIYNTDSNASNAMGD
ncbi:MAG: hypothetical protein IJM25_11900 [Eubacterium sp.]|nr:hypothetical protein [Eubacterium sp.]